MLKSSKKCCMNIHKKQLNQYKYLYTNFYLTIIKRLKILKSWCEIMSDKEKTIEVLQAIVTGLSANSFGHRIQEKGKRD